VVGGVAANQALRDAVGARFSGLRVVVPPFDLCTDNAAMIAAAGFHLLDRGVVSLLSMAADPSLRLDAA
jgi:N6-L-threonylcarbamoyladenine synthase